MASSSAAWETKETKAKKTFYAEGLYDVVSLLAQLKTGCAVEVTSVPVHEAAAVVEVLSRAARSDDFAWENPKLNNLRRVRDLASKLHVIRDGLLVLLDEDPADTGAGRELWKYGWALRNGAEHLQGKGADKFRSVGNLLIRHGDHVVDAIKAPEWLRGRIPNLRRQVTDLQEMSVSVPLDKYGPVYFDSEEDIGGGSDSGNKGGGGSGSGSGNKDGGGSGSGNKGGDGDGSGSGYASKAKGVSVASDSKAKGFSVAADSKAKGFSVAADSKAKGFSDSKAKGAADSKAKGFSGSGESSGSGDTPVKQKGYYLRKKKGYYGKKRSGKGGSGKGVSGEA